MLVLRHKLAKYNFVTGCTSRDYLHVLRFQLLKKLLEQNGAAFYEDGGTQERSLRKT